MLNIPHNPDILTCLADLSSDEVFTPPDVANQMLDQLPKEIWSDESATFLDQLMALATSFKSEWPVSSIIGNPSLLICDINGW